MFYSCPGTCLPVCVTKRKYSEILTSYIVVIASRLHRLYVFPVLVSLSCTFGEETLFLFVPWHLPACLRCKQEVPWILTSYITASCLHRLCSPVLVSLSPTLREGDETMLYSCPRTCLPVCVTKRMYSGILTSYTAVNASNLHCAPLCFPDSSPVSVSLSPRFRG